MCFIVEAQQLTSCCSQDNNDGYNFIIKKKVCLVHQKRKLTTIVLKSLHSLFQGQIFEVQKHFIFHNLKKKLKEGIYQETMKISALYFLYNQEF